MGAPVFALALAVFPIAPEPFGPVVSTPVKLITLMDARRLCESVAVAVTLVMGEVAKARQISELPLCAFVRESCAAIRVTVVLIPDK